MPMIARSRPERLPLLALFSAALTVWSGCAHSGAAKTTSAEPPVRPAPSGERVRFASEELGVSLEEPQSYGFESGANLGVLAHAPDSSELRVFIEHLSQEASERSCWDRLYHRVPGRLLDSPRDVDELIALATAGISRGDRFVYLSVHPKGTRCYVLVGEGPRKSLILQDAVQAARKTFVIGEPSKVMSAELDIDGGMQLLEGKEYLPALQNFEAALAITPDNHRAHFGAGLAAYFAGPEQAGKAIEHLLVVTSVGPTEDVPPQLRPEQMRDALMYLGLAYAAKKQFSKATSTLAELVARTPADATGRYNLACVLALSGDSEAAMGELTESLQQEPSLIAHAKQDDDLKSLRGLPAWDALFQKLTSAPVGPSER